MAVIPAPAPRPNPKPPPRKPSPGKPEGARRRRSGSLPRRARRRVLRLFARIERTCAWLLLAAGVVTFVGVLVRLIDVGDFRWPTLLIAAGLVVDGFGAVQEAENGDDAD